MTNSYVQYTAAAAGRAMSAAVRTIAGIAASKSGDASPSSAIINSSPDAEAADPLLANTANKDSRGSSLGFIVESQLENVSESNSARAEENTVVDDIDELALGLQAQIPTVVSPRSTISPRGKSYSVDSVNSDIEVGGYKSRRAPHAGIPLMIVCNKIDKLTSNQLANLQRTCSNHVFVSAASVDTPFDPKAFEIFFNELYVLKQQSATSAG